MKISVGNVPVMPGSETLDGDVLAMPETFVNDESLFFISVSDLYCTTSIVFHTLSASTRFICFDYAFSVFSFAAYVSPVFKKGY